MASSFENAVKYLPIVDGVFKKESKSAILDTPAVFAGVGIDSAKVLKISTQGLVNYAGAYVTGDVTSTWETITLPYKRTRALPIDAIANSENFDYLLGGVLGEFTRVNVVPEVDAIRFGNYFGSAGTVVRETLTASTAYTSVLTALGGIENSEANLQNSVLFVNAALFPAFAQITTAGNILGIDALKDKYGLVDVRFVPTTRFNTSITLNNTGNGGYSAAGQAINYMVVDKSAVCQVIKLENQKLITPDMNQTAYGWSYDYLIYHTAKVLENKTAGIYVSALPVPSGN
jgi:hypothetical protein